MLIPFNTKIYIFKILEPAVSFVGTKDIIGRWLYSFINLFLEMCKNAGPTKCRVINAEHRHHNENDHPPQWQRLKLLNIFYNCSWKAWLLCNKNYYLGIPTWAGGC